MRHRQTSVIQGNKRQKYSFMKEKCAKSSHGMFSLSFKSKTDITSWCCGEHFRTSVGGIFVRWFSFHISKGRLGKVLQ